MTCLASAQQLTPFAGPPQSPERTRGKNPRAGAGTLQQRCARLQLSAQPLRERRRRLLHRSVGLAYNVGSVGERMDTGRTVLDRLAYVRVQDVLLLCTGEGDATDQDLTKWLERLAVQDYRCLLVSTRSTGGLTSKQRSRIAEFWKSSSRRPPPVALLSDSALARGVLTALSWLLESPTKAFSPSDLRGALAYLGTHAPAAQISSQIDALDAALAKKSRRSA
jgi:hypothetical protein